MVSGSLLISGSKVRVLDGPPTRNRALPGHLGVPDFVLRGCCISVHSLLSFRSRYFRDIACLLITNQRGRRATRQLFCVDAYFREGSIPLLPPCYHLRPAAGPASCPHLAMTAHRQPDALRLT